MSEFKHIAIVGTGYVGLVTGSCLAMWGHHVTCVDIDADRISQLNQGHIPIYEPGLSTVVEACRTAGTLRFTTDMKVAMKGADCVFIAVGTPSRLSDGTADLSSLLCAVGKVADTFEARTGSERNLTIVVKSTVPPGTGDRIERQIRERRPGISVAVISNPEFLREGTAISDFQMPDRIVIGGDDARAIRLINDIYLPLTKMGVPVIRTSRTSAELIKYASNAFLAVKIGIINEIADLCEATGANVSDVARGMGSDRRIGAQFLDAGPGYGGSCFPKDTLALVRAADEHGVDLSIVKQTISANDARRRGLAQKFTRAFGRPVAGAHIAVLGLTFKANTDDMRDSPSIALIETLQNCGAIIHATDPQGMKQARKMLRDIACFNDPYACAKGCDAVIFMTGWDSLRRLQFDKLARCMSGRTLVDFRRMIDADEARQSGFNVYVIGEARSETSPDHSALRFVINSQKQSASLVAKRQGPVMASRKQITAFHLNGSIPSGGESRST